MVLRFLGRQFQSCYKLEKVLSSAGVRAWSGLSLSVCVHSFSLFVCKYEQCSGELCVCVCAWVMCPCARCFECVLSRTHTRPPTHTLHMLRPRTRSTCKTVPQPLLQPYAKYTYRYHTRTRTHPRRYTKAHKTI